MLTKFLASIFHFNSYSAQQVASVQELIVAVFVVHIKPPEFDT